MSEGSAGAILGLLISIHGFAIGQRHIARCILEHAGLRHGT